MEAGAATVQEVDDLHRHRRVEEDDEQRREDHRDDGVDVGEDTSDVEVARQRHAHAGLEEWHLEHAGRPQREGVEDDGEHHEGRDDDAGPAPRAQTVLAQRVIHDNVALERETDHCPHGQEAVHVRRVDDEPAPSRTHERVYVQVAQPHERERY